MTILCITTERLPGIRPCTHRGMHRVTCPDHDGWQEHLRPGTCTGCLPRSADRGYLCNPDHLEAVSAAENTRRNFAPGPVTARTGMCRRGHSMEDAYTRPDGKGRQCAECIRIRTARATEKRRRQNA